MSAGEFSPASVRAAALDIDAAAKQLAESLDYPWEYMPEEGRNNMRAVINTALSAAPAGGLGEVDVMRGKMSLAAEISRLESIISEFHSWIVCSAICTDEDMMNNSHRIAAITHPQYDGCGNADHDPAHIAAAQGEGK